MARLTQAGFGPETIFNLGSLKYDVAALDSSDEADISAWWDRTGWNGEKVILLGGSTHPGEEDVLARIFLDLRDEFPALRLVLVPRHAERSARRPRHVRAAWASASCCAASSPPRPSRWPTAARPTSWS